MELSKNTILITGGTSGIGLALANALQELDNTVILMGRNRSKLDKLKQKGFKTIACDLGKPEEIEEAVVRIENQYSGLNMLFNNAGVQFNYHFTDGAAPLHSISQEISINLTGQIMLTYLLIPVLSSAEKSWIINTTSGLGAFPKKDGLVYSASKAALRNFNMGLNYALKDTSIGVMEFIPTVTDTEMTKGRAEDKMSAEELVRQIIPQIKKERKILTISKMRMFLWIAFLFPGLANKILSK